MQEMFETEELKERVLLIGVSTSDQDDTEESLKELAELTKKLEAMGPSKIVITGIPQGSYVANYCYETGREPSIIKTHRVGTSRCGTGDIFSSIISADAVNGVEFYTSVRKASLFIKKCILKSIELDTPLTDGVCFEEVLYKLK